MPSAYSWTLPSREVFVASVILALAAGKSYSRIEAELNTTRPTIARWKARFEQRGIEGLEPLYKGSKPTAATPAAQAKVLR